MNFFNSKYILSNKRFGWIDYDRGISIILVTYRHCFESLEKAGLDVHKYPYLEYINVFFFGFRMPLFFIASGIFISGSMRKRGLNAYAKNRVQSILYPMMLWGIIQISLQILMSGSGYVNSDVGPISYLYLLIWPRTTGQFWYLNALFFVGIIYAVLKSFARFEVKHQLIFGLILYALNAYVNHRGINIYLGADICKYYIFFAIGDYISAFMLEDKTSKIFTSWKVILPLFVAFMTIQYFFTKINMLPHINTQTNTMEVSNYYVENHMPIFFLAVALVGCAMSIALSFSFKKYDTARFLRVVGYNSVHIYCMQIIAMSIARLFFLKIGITYVPGLVLLVLASGVMIPMVVYNICLRFNLWWLFTLKRPPEEEINHLAKPKLFFKTR
jgi:fucose 4-O-acetylase-like acetyltransferase